eukprot:189054-Amphidinium_carterae.1
MMLVQPLGKGSKKIDNPARAPCKKVRPSLKHIVACECQVLKQFSDLLNGDTDHVRHASGCSGECGKCASCNLGPLRATDSPMQIQNHLWGTLEAVFK